MVCPHCKKMIANNLISCPRCGQVLVELPPEELERINSIVVTTSPNIEGYRIVKYLGIVSGESSVGTGFLSEFLSGTADVFGTEAGAYSSKLGQSKANALERLKSNALKIGADAVIAVDIDVLTTNNNIFITCANGTAVKLEKIN